jgi:hypothetical protein
MSQKIQIKPDSEYRAYPVIVCDHCGEVITTAKDGNTIWRESTPGSRKQECFYSIQHTHKRCNYAFMNVRFPEPADYSWTWMSHDLPHDLFMLLLNTNYDASSAKRQAEWMAML